MTSSEITILVSFGSLFISALSLALTVYKDLIRRPKLRVSIQIGKIVHPNFNENQSRICITITNFGPGKTRASLLQLRKTSLFRKLFRKQVYALLIHDYEDPLSGHIPVDLEEGANANLSFRFSNGTFLEENFNQVGVSDPFGKVHWCSKKNFQYAQKTYKEQKVEMSSEEHPSA